MGFVSTVLLVCYGPLIVWAALTFRGKQGKNIPNHVKKSFLIVLSYSMVFTLSYLFVYALTRSGI